jgi:hypothetical protein
MRVTLTCSYTALLAVPIELPATTAQLSVRIPPSAFTSHYVLMAAVLFSGLLWRHRQNQRRLLGYT